MSLKVIQGFALIWLFFSCNNAVRLPENTSAEVSDSSALISESQSVEVSTTAQEMPDSNAKVVLAVLGVMQDGGRPHLGCEKSCCAPETLQNMNDFLVVSLGIFDREHAQGYMIEATPDFVPQWRTFKGIFPEITLKTFGGIFLTHAHIGHYLGLAYLGKEAFNAHGTPVYAMPRMAEFLKNNGPWSQLVDINNIKIKEINFGTSTTELNNINVTPIQVPHRDEYSETAGYIIKGKNKKALFIPDIDKVEKWDRDLSQLAKEFDFLLIDATFYDSKEINRDISEIPHPLVTETMNLLIGLNKENRNKVYFIHMNHTNMMLDPNSELSKLITSKGFNIARLGQKLYL